MKFRRIDCPHCGYEGRPIKGTKGRTKRKGMTRLCAGCRGIVVQQS